MMYYTLDFTDAGLMPVYNNGSNIVFDFVDSGFMPILASFNNAEIGLQLIILSQLVQQAITNGNIGIDSQNIILSQLVQQIITNGDITLNLQTVNLYQIIIKASYPSLDLAIESVIYDECEIRIYYNDSNIRISSDDYDIISTLV